MTNSYFKATKERILRLHQWLALLMFAWFAGEALFNARIAYPVVLGMEAIGLDPVFEASISNVFRGFFVVLCFIGISLRIFQYLLASSISEDS